MRVPRIEEWSVAGDPTDGDGRISYQRIPLHWWLLDRWLAHGHPDWEWWYRIWGRIMPHWGDPFCAAYCVAWSRLYWSHQEEPATIEVGWDSLPGPIKASIMARLEDDAVEEGDPTRREGRARTRR